MVQNDRLMRAPEVLMLTGMSRTTLYRRVSAGDFPVAVKLGPRAVAWRASEIDAWMEALPANETGATNDPARQRGADTTTRQSNGESHGHCTHGAGAAQHA